MLRNISSISDYSRKILVYCIIGSMFCYYIIFYFIPLFFIFIFILLHRCNPLLCLRKKWHVSHNWQYGRYKKKFIFSQKAKLMPWLQLTEDILWWSGGDRLCGFRRSEPLRGTVLVFNENDIGSDICKFVVKDDYIVSGHR